jgi:hypothetical protein
MDARLVPVFALITIAAACTPNYAPGSKRIDHMPTQMSRLDVAIKLGTAVCKQPPGPTRTRNLTKIAEAYPELEIRCSAIHGGELATRGVRGGT